MVEDDMEAGGFSSARREEAQCVVDALEVDHEEALVGLYLHRSLTREICWGVELDHPVRGRVHSIRIVTREMQESRISRFVEHVSHGDAEIGGRLEECFRLSGEE